MIPDIVLKQKEDGSHRFIIDAKYKRDVKNSDYYQAIAYSLAIPTVEACCLIYPQGEENIEKEPLILRSDITKPECKKIKLFTKTIDLHINDNVGYKNFVEEIKEEIKSIISQCVEQYP